MIAIKHKSLTELEHAALRNALLDNAFPNKAMLMDHETSFAGTVNDLSEEVLISAVKSTPTHY